MAEPLSPAEILDLEAQFFYLKGVESCAEWMLEPDYPVSSLWDWGEKEAAERERREIRDWWATERLRDPRYFDRFEKAWTANPQDFPPIVVAELPDGRIDIGDGWHRIAMAILHGPPRIRAIVGRKCAAARSKR